MSRMDELKAKKQKAIERRNGLTASVQNIYDTLLKETRNQKSALEAVKIHIYKLSEKDIVQHKSLYQSVWVEFKDKIQGAKNVS